MTISAQPLRGYDRRHRQGRDQPRIEIGAGGPVYAVVKGSDVMVAVD